MRIKSSADERRLPTKYERGLEKWPRSMESRVEIDNSFVEAWTKLPSTKIAT